MRAQRHDDECEQDPRGFYLCHCAKRERLAAGRVDAPSIWFRSPQCGECLNDLTWEDGYVCYTCHVEWSSDAGDGDAGEFNDDYGDDLAREAREWAAARDRAKS